MRRTTIFCVLIFTFLFTLPQISETKAAEITSGPIYCDKAIYYPSDWINLNITWTYVKEQGVTTEVFLEFLTTPNDIRTSIYSIQLPLILNLNFYSASIESSTIVANFSIPGNLWITLVDVENNIPNPDTSCQITMEKYDPTINLIDNLTIEYLNNFQYTNTIFASQNASIPDSQGLVSISVYYDNTSLYSNSTYATIYGNFTFSIPASFLNTTGLYSIALNIVESDLFFSNLLTQNFTVIEKSLIAMTVNGTSLFVPSYINEFSIYIKFLDENNNTFFLDNPIWNITSNLSFDREEIIENDSYLLYFKELQDFKNYFLIINPIQRFFSINSLFFNINYSQMPLNLSIDSVQLNVNNFTIKFNNSNSDFNELLSFDSIQLQYLVNNHWLPLNYLQICNENQDFVMIFCGFQFLSDTFNKNLTLSIRLYYQEDNYFLPSFSNIYSINLSDWIANLFSFRNYTIDPQNSILWLFTGAKWDISNSNISNFIKQFEPQIQIQFENNTLVINGSFNENFDISVDIQNIESELLNALQKQQNLLIILNFDFFNQTFEIFSFNITQWVNVSQNNELYYFLIPIPTIPVIILGFFKIKSKRNKQIVDLNKYSII